MLASSPAPPQPHGQSCKRKIQQNLECARYKTDDWGMAPSPWCKSSDQPLLWTKVKALLDNQFVPVHCRAMGMWRTFTVCTTNELASSSMMQHFSAHLRRKKSSSHVQIMSIITSERHLNSMQVQEHTVRWMLYCMLCHRGAEKGPTKSDQTDFRKINTFQTVPWLQSGFWGTTTFTQDVAISKDFVNFQRANRDPICAVRLPFTPLITEAAVAGRFCGLLCSSRCLSPATPDSPSPMPQLDCQNFLSLFFYY